ncbi:MAG TPA: GTPase, partial [Pirellulales bacterium]
MFDLADTIAAIASPPGGAARGIVRVSGPNLLSLVAGLFSADEPCAIEQIRLPTAIAGRLALRSLGSPLPCTLYLWPSSRSYTRQPTAELHTLGSPPLLQAVLGELCEAGARPARPGEFTLRAFLAGRLDLTQAEAVLGVIDARGPRQLAAALAQLAGGLAAPLTRLRDDLLDLLAHIEAGLDFVDEDIELIAPDELTKQLQAAQHEIDRLARQMDSRGETSEAVRAVLVGAANVGKTSLYNALTAQTAIVSPQAGTTRDYLRAKLELDGVVCELIDTAGVIWQPPLPAPALPPSLGDASSSVAPALVAGPRPHADSANPPHAADTVSHAAHRAATELRQQADIEIFCLDATRPLNAWEHSSLLGTSHSARIVVLTKVDQPGTAALRAADDLAGGSDAIATSSVSGVGLEPLRARLRAIVAAQDSDQLSAVTAARCHDSLRQADAALAHARELAVSRQGEELVAAELRLALDALGQVVGTVYTDDVLDRIFSRFC